MAKSDKERIREEVARLERERKAQEAAEKKAKNLVPEKKDKEGGGE